LEQLLDFLNLPGGVLPWLPLRDMTVKHALPVQFCYKAAAIQAAEDMLSFPPVLAVDSLGVQNCWAAFLVTTTGSLEAPLLVRAVQFSSTRTITKVKKSQPGAASAATGAQTQLHNYGTIYEFIGRVMTVSSTRNAGTSSALVSATDHGGDSLISTGSVWERLPWAGNKKMLSHRQATRLCLQLTLCLACRWQMRYLKPPPA
jgi:hypothetical protein